MPDPTSLGIGYTSLQAEIADFLGYGRTASAWTADQVAELNALIASGLRQFYWPTQLQSGPVARWSFLSPRSTLATIASTQAYALPLDYAGNLRQFVYQDTSNSPPLTIVTPEALLAMAESSPQSGRPAYATIQPNASDGTSQQSWSILLYPTPDQAYSLSYRYDVNAPVLSSTVLYPLGGPAHAETVLESCLAVAEERRNDTSTIHRQRFADRLAASQAYDASIDSNVSATNWPVLAPAESALDVTYTDLMRHVGQYLGFGWDQTQWTRDQNGQADDLVQSGIRQFYSPPPLPSQMQGLAETITSTPGPAHQWTFLRLNQTTTTSPGNAMMTLPADFSGRFDGDITFAAGSQKVHIKLISDDRLRDLQAANTTEGPPQYVAIRSNSTIGTARQTWEALLYPTPDQGYALNFRYITIPPRISPTNPYPLGGVLHAQTVLASCLAAAEARVHPDQTFYRTTFSTCLVASIQLDTPPKEEDLTWPLNDLDPTSLDITYSQLLKRVGKEMGLGWDQATWTVAERKQIDMIIQSGLRQFYTPAPLPGERWGWEWSFLRPIATITTTPPFSDGTITVTNGVVTLTTTDGGTFPPWAATGYVVIGTACMYQVASMQSGTQLMLTDDTVNFATTGGYSVVPGFAYDLPDDFAAIEGPLTFSPTDGILKRNIEVVAEWQVRAKLAEIPWVLFPRMAAIRPKPIDETTWTRYEILFWPIPDDTYTLSYRYQVNIQPLNDTNQYPPGAQPHGETILESCLAIAEQTRDGKPGLHTARFAERLSASVSADRKASAPEFLGYNSDHSDRIHGRHWPYLDWHDYTVSATTYNGVVY
jgi:hypothetical protein